jgi:F-type H+-transporting ATPase subunit epsilon
MAGTFKFELVSPERVLMSADAEQAILPGADGIFAVLAGHAPVVTTLLPGIARITAGGSTKRIYLKGGFAEVGPDSVTVLAERAFMVDDADRRQIEAELEAAQKLLSGPLDDEARMQATRAVEELRALVGTKVAA